jgi:hypothetical protein
MQPVDLASFAICLMAREAELSALVQHGKVATALRAATGVLLDDRGIVLEVRGR